MSDEHGAEEQEEVADLEVPMDEADDVKGGRKAGKGQQEYLTVTLQDVQVSSYNSGP